MLNEDERKVLHDIMIVYEKEKLSTQHSKAGEGSGVEYHDEASETFASTQPESTSVVDPQSVPAYNPDQPRLSPVHEHVTEAAPVPPASQTEEGILSISCAHSVWEALFEAITNNFIFVFIQ